MRQGSDSAGVEPALLPDDPREKFERKTILRRGGRECLAEGSQIVRLLLALIALLLHAPHIRGGREVELLSVAAAFRLRLRDLRLHRIGSRQVAQHGHDGKTNDCANDTHVVIPNHNFIDLSCH